MKTFMIYAKFSDTNKFKPLDTTNGCTVSNLMYATIIHEEKLEAAKQYCRQVNQDDPTIRLQIRPTNSSRPVFSI